MYNKNWLYINLPQIVCHVYVLWPFLTLVGEKDLPRPMHVQLVDGHSVKSKKIWKNREHKIHPTVFNADNTALYK